MSDRGGTDRRSAFRGSRRPGRSHLGSSIDRVDLIAAVVLAIGYVSIAAATLLARRAPANGFEASIYAATPLATWAAIVSSLLVGVTIAFLTRSSLVRSLSIGLGTLSILLVVLLPIVRGYRYLGEGDALTHLGYARSIAGGAIAPTEVLYPAIHLLGIALAAVSVHPLEVTMLLIAPAFVLVFVVFVSLSVRIVHDDGRAVAIAAFAALCLLPINGIAVHLQAHPSTMAILYLPVIVYCVLAGIRTPRPAMLSVLALVIVAYVLIHPMHAGNVLLMVAAVAAVQVGRRVDADSIQSGSIANGTRSVALVTLGIVGVAFLGWMVFASFDQLHRFWLTVRVSVLIGSPADAIFHHADALATIGAGVGELFVKQFLVSFAFSVLAGGLMAYALYRRFHSDDPLPLEPGAATAYLAIGFVPIVCTFLVFLFIGLDTFAFRQVGFLMALVTIVGAIAIYRIDRRASTVVPRPVLDVLTVAFVAIVLLASLVVIYPSPYVYQSMGHVPEAQVDGYETTFDLRDEGIPFSHLRSLPHRYSDAIHGQHAHDRPHFYGGDLSAPAPDNFADHDLPGYYDEPRYLVVTGADREREANVFEGLRFAESDFEYLETERNVDRVQTNDQFDLYVIRPRESDAGDDVGADAIDAPSSEGIAGSYEMERTRGTEVP